MNEHRIFETVQIVCYFKVQAWDCSTRTQPPAPDGEGVVARACLSSLMFCDDQKYLHVYMCVTGV